MVSMELRFHQLFFFQFIAYQPLQFLPIFMRKQATSWKPKIIDALFIAWKVLDPSTPWLMLYSLRFLFLLKIKPTNVFNGQSWKNKDISAMFIAWKVLKPFRDHRSHYFVLLGVFMAITYETLKVHWQVKHCKKGFCEIFQMSLTERYVFIPSEKIYFLFFLPVGKFLII